MMTNSFLDDEGWRGTLDSYPDCLAIAEAVDEVPLGRTHSEAQPQVVPRSVLVVTDTELEIGAADEAQPQEVDLGELREEGESDGPGIIGPEERSPANCRGDSRMCAGVPG